MHIKPTFPLALISLFPYTFDHLITSNSSYKITTQKAQQRTSCIFSTSAGNREQQTALTLVKKSINGFIKGLMSPYLLCTAFAKDLVRKSFYIALFLPLFSAVRVKIRSLVENYPGLELTKGCDQDDDVENYFR